MKFTLEVDLQNNKIASLDLPSGLMLVGRKPEAGGDYRRTMLSNVIPYLLESDRDRVVQQLLPERLSIYLDSYKVLTLPFSILQNGEATPCRLTAKKTAGVTRIEVEVGVAEAAREEEIVGRPKVILRLTPESDSLVGRWLSEKYDVISAKSAIGAEEALKNRGPFTAVLCEYPAEIRQIGKLCSGSMIPTMAVCEDADVEACLKNGAFEVLRKPLNRAETESRIQHFLERAETHQLVTDLETDQFTGLYVGATFYRKAGEEIRKAKDERTITVLTIVDFVLQGEKFGKAVADMVLKHITEQINQFFPKGMIAGRISMAEFAVLSSPVEADQLENMVRSLIAKAPISGLEVKAGIARIDGSMPIEMVTGRARTALLKVVGVYGVNVAEYNEMMARETLREHQILGSMAEALEKEQFVVYYQPKHDSVTGLPTGAEALVRWQHPTLGKINPGQFIPIFERVGFIRGLDRYVWTKVLLDLRRRIDAGLPVVPVSVNLSRRDFETNDLAAWLIDMTTKLGVDRSLLHLEITESAYTADVERVTTETGKLHEAGFVIELDDFGTGYSSLLCINNIDIDILKIDRGIVQNEAPGQKRSILEFCVRLAKMMGMKTVAEGVETEAQYRRVQNLKCDWIQGYYFSEPLPVEEFDRYLKQYMDNQ